MMIDAEFDREDHSQSPKTAIEKKLKSYDDKTDPKPN
jgi:hypothetical protein